MNGLDAVFARLLGLVVTAGLILFLSRRFLVPWLRIPAFTHVHGGRATQVERMRCKDPPTFSGDPAELKEWLFVMTESLAVLSPNDPVAFAASFLHGNARRWFINLCEQNNRPASWPNLKEALSRSFAPRHYDQRNRMRLVQLRQTGDLEEYVTSFYGLSLQAVEVDELTKATLFVNGLREAGIRKEVLRDHPRTLQDAIRATRDCYDFRSECTDHVCGDSRTTRERMPEAISFNTMSTERRERLFRQRRCFRCEQVGHRAAECPRAGDRRRFQKAKGQLQQDRNGDRQ